MFKQCGSVKLCLLSLKNFPALSGSPSVKDWSETSVSPDICVGMIRKSVTKLETTLQEMTDKLAESGEIYFIIRIYLYSVTPTYERL